MRRLRHDRLVFLPILVWSLFPELASASGFMVLEQDPGRMATAYEINDSLAVEVGHNYQWADMALESQVDAFNACLGAGGSTAGCSNSAHRGLANQAVDNSAEIGGNDHDVLVDLSIHWRPDERWQLHVDIAWTGWESRQTIGAVNDSSQLPVSELNLNHHDTMRYVLGASMRQNESWTWRFGMALDQAPQSAARYITPRTPYADRIWAAIGFNYSLRRNLSVDVGYVHLFVDDSSIELNSQGNQLTGPSENSVDMLGVQGTWHF